MSYSLLDIPADDDPIARGPHFGRYCMIMIVVSATGLLVMLVAMAKLVGRARQIPPIVAFTSDHRPITGKVTRLGMNNDRFVALLQDVGESSLTRTKLGFTPALTNFLTPSCAQKLQAQATMGGRPNQHDFVQVFTVDEKDGVRVVSG